MRPVLLRGVLAGAVALACGIMVSGTGAADLGGFEATLAHHGIPTVPHGWTRTPGPG